MSAQIYDVAIIGLGPAGSTLARLIGGGMSVVALDKKTDGGGFKKPCGGLLSPDAQKALAAHQLTLPKDVLVDPQIFTVRTYDTEAKLARDYYRPYINLDRHKFDKWLISLIPPAVDILEGAVCQSIQCREEGFVVRYGLNGVSSSLRAKYVVGADGARSLVRRFLYPDNRPRTYTSIQQWFDHDAPQAMYLCAFDRDVSPCYSWAISKGEYLIFGGAYPVRQSRALFELQKDRLRQQGYVLGAPVRTEACAVLCPRVHRDVLTGHGGAFLIGEAGGFISPSSLEGISYAINSATALALSLSHPKPNRAYKRKTARLKAKLFVKQLKAFVIYTPFTRRLIMKSGITALKPPVPIE